MVGSRRLDGKNKNGLYESAKKLKGSGKRSHTCDHSRCKRFCVSSAVVLSSDDEEEADNASTGSANRLDSVSPRPADSAHSSPAPSGGRVEAAVKGVAEQDEPNTEFFEDVNMKITIPRRARMKDQVRLS